ncbi:MAG: zinc metallopeptidase [Bacteroidaceae bacterium]|nr:zinc metallopeptidase [Bacteroidaceae bacterium]
MIIWIIFIAIALASFIVQRLLEKHIEEAKKVPLKHGLSGKEVAEFMLSNYGVNGVKIVSIGGVLTDHYDPAQKIINLSSDVYNGRDVAAAAVAAHETGHALQHALGYHPLKMRSALVPFVAYASRFTTWVILAGIILIEMTPMVMLAGILLFAVSTIFSFVTLPVELNASQRALDWLNQADIVSPDQAEIAEKALKSAANTYVVAAMSSLATLIYYILIFMGRRE